MGYPTIPSYCEENNNPRDMTLKFRVGVLPNATLQKKIKAMLVLLFTCRSPARPRWRGGLARRIWTPGIAGSTPVARRFSVTKPVS